MFCTTGTSWEEEGCQEEEDDTQTEEGCKVGPAVPTLVHGNGILLGKAAPASVLTVFWGAHHASQCLFLGVDLEISGQMAAAFLCLMFHD